jgi:hypothetical protein
MRSASNASGSQPQALRNRVPRRGVSGCGAPPLCGLLRSRGKRPAASRAIGAVNSLRMRLIRSGSGMPPRRGAGGETGDQALEVLGGGGELLHERGEEGVAGEAAGDQGEQAGQDRPDARSEFGGVGVGRRCRRRLHGPHSYQIPRTKSRTN